MQTVVVIVILLGVAVDRPTAPAVNPPHEEPAAVYDCQCCVGDAISSGFLFGQTEKRDDHLNSGSYRVSLPDGITQMVAYHVGDDGYVA